MPQEPKKRHSRQRQGKRRASIRLNVPKTVFCPNCGNPTLSHAICKKCGYYKGKEFLNLKKEENKDKAPLGEK